MFEVDKEENGTLTWIKGGYQGAEGSDSGGSWYIENVREELDSPNEFFFDTATRELLYVFNTSKSPSSVVFESTELKVLLSIKGGNKETPARDILIQGIEFRDAAYTFMDPHGMPSGGDWGLQRSGALLFENTVDVLVEGIKVTRCDGNGIFINNYNRNLTIQKSELVWIGDSAIAAWGSTEQGLGGGSIKLPEGVGIDGTGGNQPRGTQIISNVIHEFGLFQKQSSAFFQAQACQTTITGNILYNGPRAHINFNDQFGGANNISSNLIFNACRETADHGPFNSWGRQPYITRVRDGQTPSITPAFTGIDRNFVIGNYHTQEAIDNDDASEYFESHHNVFVYGGNGLKSDFSGHDNRHHDNLYAFVNGDCMGVGSFLPGHEDEFSRNKCILQTDAKTYAGFDCNSPSLPVMFNNTVMTPNGGPLSQCGMDLKAWQALGHDKGTTVAAWPDNWDGEEVLDWARGLLF